jgi:LacI family transcriptional regulator
LTSGVILAAASGETMLTGPLARVRVPLVALDPGAGTAARLPRVGARNHSGAREAVEYLLSLGHLRIGMITGSVGGLVCSQERLDGYLTALADAGIPEDPELIVHGSFEHQSGLDGARRLLRLADPPTAIFACSDHIATGVLEAARRRSLSVPADLSVVGFDDLPFARWSSPPLTTVRQPLHDMGQLAARTVLNLTLGERLDSQQIQLSTHLIVRGSTAPPRLAGR